MNWSFQLYSARNFQPWEGVVETLARLGYKEVEGFGGVYADPAGFRRVLDANGLSMPTAHFPYAMLQDDFDGARRIADALGTRLMVCPHIAADQRPTDAEGWRAFGRSLAAIGERAKNAGYGFAWHNHDFEFKQLADGSVPQAHIFEAAPDLGWEIDVAWVVRGGGDPMKWIADHGARIVSVHVKDIAPAGEALDEDGWSDVGHGTIDWRGAMAALRKTPARHFIMEHDKPSDFERFARRSIEAAKTF
jgi:sugar phosphate isomerase/epimerase